MLHCLRHQIHWILINSWDPHRWRVQSSICPMTNFQFAFRFPGPFLLLSNLSNHARIHSVFISDSITSVCEIAHDAKISSSRVFHIPIIRFGYCSWKCRWNKLKNLKHFWLRSQKPRCALGTSCWLDRVLIFQLYWPFQNLAFSWCRYFRNSTKIYPCRKAMLIIFWSTITINNIDHFPDHDTLDRVH
jgi:hypothetical protein